MTPEPNSAAWWDTVASRYDAAGDDRDRPQEFAAISSYCIPGPVVEIGCAFGAFREYVPDGVAYCGVDISPAMVERARLWRPFSLFIVADVLDPPTCLLGAFKTAVACQVLEHMPDLDAAIGAIRRLATENLVVTVPRGARTPEAQATDGHVRAWEDETALAADLGRFGAVKTIHVVPHHIAAALTWE